LPIELSTSHSVAIGEDRSDCRYDYAHLMAEPRQLSRSAYERLSTELADLTTRGRIDIARKIETARELGDLSENGDYHAAKEEQGKMEGRIMHLEALLEDVVVVDEVATTDHVSNGNVVTIRYDGDDQTEQYLVGSIEERREGITVMSPGSPLGAALLGAKVGETVTYQAPGGQLAVEIVAIEA
jgi:transcription elongation factor GreA